MVENIEQLCKELHERVGFDKTIKIIIEELNPIGESEQWTEFFNSSVENRLNMNICPFAKLSTSKGIQWSYISGGEAQNQKEIKN